MGLRKSMNHLSLKKTTVEDAVNYSEENKVEPGKWTGLSIEGIDVIQKGMENGKPTVDIRLKDPETGKLYVAMTTGSLFMGAATMVKSEME